VNNNFIRSNQNKNNNNRNRNRNNNRRNTGGGMGGGGGGPNNKVFDSNGPDIKLRGTTQTIAEKYMQLGRDSQSSGDSVAAENYYQHAEHYYRMWAASQPVGHSLQMSRKLGEEEFDEDGEEQNAGEEDGEAVPGENNLIEGGQSQENAGDAGAVSPDGQQPRQQRNTNPRDNNNRNFRPRWPNNNRNNRNFENRDNGPVEGAVTADAPAPVEYVQVAQEPATMEAGQWEAPSFLQRPTPVVLETPVEAETAADTPVPRRPRTRKPRIEVDSSPVETPGDSE
jgi:Domain of unknown function (DUF4167)